MTDTKEPRCDAGCTVFYGGERKHLKTCPFYPESRTEMYDKAQARIDAQDAKIKALVEALGRLVKTYSNMEDGEGEPCPDVANARAALAAAKETTA